MKVRVIAVDNMKDGKNINPHTRPEQTMKKTTEDHCQYHRNYNHLHQCPQHNHNLQHDDDDDDIRRI